MIKDFYESPKEIIEEAQRIEKCLEKLCGTGRSHWSLQLGISEERRAEAKEIVLRAKMLQQLVIQRTRR